MKNLAVESCEEGVKEERRKLKNKCVSFVHGPMVVLILKQYKVVWQNVMLRIVAPLFYLMCLSINS